MIKTLKLDLGIVRAMQVPSLSSGWYVNPVTGQRYYYNAAERQWYVYAAGLLYAMSYMNPAPKQVSVAPGDQLKVIISFGYMGPAISSVLSRWCIGVFGAAGFTEQVVATPTFNVPANSSSTPITVTQQNIFTIPAGVGTDWTSIYVKMWGGSPDIGGSEQLPAFIYGYQDALVITGAIINISNFVIADFVKV